MDEIGNGWAPKTLEAWRFVQQVLADVTQTVIDDALDERELLEGLRVIAKATGLVPSWPSRPTGSARASSTCARTPG